MHLSYHISQKLAPNSTFSLSSHDLRPPANGLWFQYKPTNETVFGIVTYVGQEVYDKFALEIMVNCPVRYRQLYQIQFQLLDQLTEQNLCFPVQSLIYI